MQHDSYFLCFPGTKLSLDLIRRRLQVSSVYGKSKDAEESKVPLFKTDIVLAIPLIQIRPSLDKIQKYLTDAVQTILRMTNDFPTWRHAKVQQQQQQKVAFPSYIMSSQPIPAKSVDSLL